MDLSVIQEAHSWLRALFPVGRDAQYIFVAFLLVILTMLASRRGFGTWWVITPGLIFIGAVEVLDTLDMGLHTWTAHFGDFIISAIIPIFLVFGTRLGWLK